MEYLPIEILLQIFDLLDSETLRNVSVLCQRFQSIIHNDVKIMNKFRVCINSSNLSSCKKTLSDMPYRKFDIFASQYCTRMSLGQFEGRIKSIIDDHSKNIENLRLFDSTTGMASTILVSLENLTHLSIERIQKSDIEEDDAQFSVTLPNLKVLEVNGIDSYLKCIKSPKVEIFKYRSEHSSLIQQNPYAVSRSLNNFLKRSHNLKDLTMFGDVTNFEIEKFQFKLEKVKFTNYFTNVDENEDSPMINLLKSQKDNIKELTVTECVTQKILLIAINEMKNLEKFKVNLDKVFAEPQNLRMNFKLKKLEIINLPNFYHHVLKIIKNCPNVEILKFSSIIPEFVLQEISNSMKNLQQLTLKSANHVTSDQMSFKNLKSLTILEISNQEQFKNLIKFCKLSPNLFELEIFHMTHEMSHKTLDRLIKSSENVEILKLHGLLVINDYTASVLYENITKLKLVVLDIEIDEFTDDCIRVIQEGKVQCIVPDLIRTMKYYEDDDQASNSYLQCEPSSGGCDEDSESDDFSDFFDSNCESYDEFESEECSECSNQGSDTDDSDSEDCDEFEGSERSFEDSGSTEYSLKAHSSSKSDPRAPSASNNVHENQHQYPSCQYHNHSDINIQNDHNLPSTSNQFGFYNELSNNEDHKSTEESAIDDENDGDDEEENDEKLYIHEDSSPTSDSQLEQSSSNNHKIQDVKRKNQFQIIQIESLFDMSDENDGLNNNVGLQDSNNQESSINQEDSDESSTTDNENSENSSINESDLLVEIGIQKRPRDIEQGISSEEDILIEITERKRKIRKVC